MADLEGGFWQIYLPKPPLVNLLETCSWISLEAAFKSACKFVTTQHFHASNNAPEPTQGRKQDDYISF
jgi:hypothetical protein